MKKTGIIAVLSILIVLLQASFCFAGTLTLEESYPHDGGKGLQPVNCAVKLYFNQDVSDMAHREANTKCLKITDAKGKSQKIQVLYDKDEKGMVLVLVDKTLQENAEYKLSISGNFTAASGDKLGAAETITFHTRDTKNDMTVNMVMMGVMFAGILFFSSRQMKRQAQKDAEEKQKESKVNPYKVSKATGKSVQEVVEKTEKQKQKKEAEESKRKAKTADGTPTEAPVSENGNKRVKGPRPVSQGGSAYLSGRKAKAEAEEARIAAARAAGTTRPKNQKSKKKKK